MNPVRHWWIDLAMSRFRDEFFDGKLATAETAEGE
jgi:hypothetical protein